MGEFMGKLYGTKHFPVIKSPTSLLSVSAGPNSNHRGGEFGS